MKQIIKITYGLLLFSLMGFTNLKTEDNDCLIVHKGTFIYSDIKEIVKVIIKENSHTEYHNDGKYIIQSKLEWVNDCEYNMTSTRITIPNFPYKIGDVMNVKINRVDGKDIYYTSTVREESWQGKLSKIEE